MNEIMAKIFAFIIGCLIIAGIGLLMAFAVEYLWDNSLHVIFPNVPNITYWQAFSLYILCQFLFNNSSANS